MTFNFEVGGVPYTVQLEPVVSPDTTARRVRVTIGDTSGGPAGVREVFDIESSVTDIGLSLRYLESGRSVDVGVVDRGDGEWTIGLPRATVGVVANGRRTGAPGDLGAVGEQRIVAPMPGRVVKVLVNVGDQVKARQGVVIIEAMKMENELMASREGTVQEVLVVQGGSVEAGRVLVVIG